MIFSDFHWRDLQFLGKILILLGFLGKINCQDVGKKSKKSKILATNEKSPVRNSRSSKSIQDLGKKAKTPSTGCWSNQNGVLDGFFLHMARVPVDVVFQVLCAIGKNYDCCLNNFPPYTSNIEIHCNRKLQRFHDFKCASKIRSHIRDAVKSWITTKDHVPAQPERTLRRTKTS